MASNTEILIRRSLTTDRPATLRAGELAYSYTSNTIFIGNSSGTGVVNVGGQFYTSQIDNATDANTGGTLVRRDATGNASFNYVTANYFAGTFAGNADTATALDTARDFSIDGLDVEATAVSFDGTANVILQGNLKTTGVTSGTYGGTTEIPVFTVDDKGRISSAANVSVATTLDIGADNGSNSVDLLTQTLTIGGGDGITTTVTGQSIDVSVDNTTVIRANTNIAYQKIDGNLWLSGNLTVQGNTTQLDIQTLNISDPLIYLAGNNYTSDVVDIGFVGNYFDGTTQRHTGVYRHAGNEQYYIFDNYSSEPTGNVITPGTSDFRLATLNANISALLVTANVANVQLLDFWEKGQISNPAASSGDGGAYSTLVLKPDTDLATDQYIVVDPTTPNHIHVRAGGTIDSSTAELFLGGEETNVLVSDGSKTVTIKANSLHSWVFENEGYLTLPHGATLATYSSNSIALLKSGSTACTATIGSTAGFYVDPVRANNATGGNVTVFNSTTKEIVYTDVTVNSSGITLANGTTITDVSGGGFYVDSLNYDVSPLDSANIVLYNASTGEMTYGSIGDLNPAQIANGSYSWTVSDVDGSLFSDTGIEIGASANSVVIGQNVDLTNGETGRVAIGINAASISQNAHSVAIGDSAGYNSQGTNAVALGYGAGNISQGNYGIAIGTDAGQTTQGSYAVALGTAAGGTNQGSEAVAIGAQAAGNDQGAYAVAIGSGNVGNNQGIGAIAIGRGAGDSGGQYSVALGYQAGNNDTTALGQYAIAIGYRAGYDHGFAGSIVLNASGANLSADAAGLYINPIRYTAAQDATYDGLVFYNSNTKEVRYSYALDGGSF